MAFDKDKRVLEIADAISKANDRDIPGLLLQLSATYKSVKGGTRESAILKQTIWDYHLLDVAILALKYDYAHAKGSWQTGVKIANLVSLLCSNLMIPDALENDFQSSAVPTAAENMLVLSRRLQDRYIKSTDRGFHVSEMNTAQLLDHFGQIIEIITQFVNYFPATVPKFLESPWFLQVFITDDEKTPPLVLELVKQCIRVHRDVFTKVPEALFFTLLDEMIYDLSTSEQPEMGGATITTLLRVAQAHPPSIEQMTHRYRGLRLLVTKWTGKGPFGREMNELLMLLDAGSAEQAQMQRFHRAATTIQAIWRSFRTRRRLAKANVSFAKFQKRYRERVEVRQKHAENERLRSALDQQVAAARQHRYRQKLEKELQLMSTLPAPIISRHLQAERTASATKIQAQWRGHRERALFSNRRSTAQTTAAVVKIQRCVRQWLKRVRRLRKDPPAFSKPAGLTDERRADLEARISESLETAPKKNYTREEQEALYERSQILMQRYIFGSRATRRKEQERDAMLARLETDAGLLLSAPGLGDASAADLETFVCRSVPIASRARALHNDRLRQLNRPWWRHLDDQDDEDGRQIDYEAGRTDVIMIDGKLF